MSVRAIEFSSRQGEHILDLFRGSGSTLIAAENTDRKAYLMEIDPPYCDVIVQRYETYSRKKARRVPWQDVSAPGRVKATSAVANLEATPMEETPENTVEAAARAAGVSARTAYRRMDDPEFRRRLQQTRDGMIQRTSGVLTASSGEGVKTLLALLKDSVSDAVRLGSARAIVELCMKVREIAELEKRITALKEQMLETMPATRVAAVLTTECVPTPGRVRTDRGVTHPTSGVWRQQAIVNIARNPLLQAVVEYGRRSMGDRLRSSLEGPRELEESDLRTDGRAKVVANPETVRIKVDAQFKPLVEPDRHQRLLEKLNQRAGTQRGKPRSKDPTRNPLGGLVFDMLCGWPMYRQPYKNSFRYLCGLYQQSHGAKCRHNHVDGVVAMRFLLGCVRQRLLAPQLRENLEKKLRAIAERECAQTQPDAVLTAKRAALAAIRGKRQRAGENLALAEGHRNNTVR